MMVKHSLNTLIIPFVLRYAYGVVDMAIPLLMLSIFAGEVVGCYILGELLGSALLSRKSRIFGKAEA